MVEERPVSQDDLVRLLDEAMEAYAEYERAPGNDLGLSVFCAHYVWERLPGRGAEEMESDPYVAG
ncbi:MAG TPA: hypothetical protein VKX16_03465 [Chloroflexota bacterium]|nr:hypothetical protein [Chloroflexota bacterium]